MEVALDGFIEIERLHLVELGQVSVEHHLLATDDVDFPIDQLHGYGQLPGGRRMLFRHGILNGPVH